MKLAIFNAKKTQNMITNIFMCGERDVSSFFSFSLSLKRET